VGIANLLRDLLLDLDKLATKFDLTQSYHRTLSQAAQQILTPQQRDRAETVPNLIIDLPAVPATPPITKQQVPDSFTACRANQASLAPTRTQLDPDLAHPIRDRNLVPAASNPDGEIGGNPRPQRDPSGSQRLSFDQGLPGEAGAIFYERCEISCESFGTSTAFLEWFQARQKWRAGTLSGRCSFGLQFLRLRRSTKPHASAFVSKLAITAPSSAITSDPRTLMACPCCGPAAHCCPLPCYYLWIEF
jgi:hypothetical protein